MQNSRRASVVLLFSSGAKTDQSWDGNAVWNWQNGSYRVRKISFVFIFDINELFIIDKMRWLVPAHWIFSLWILGPSLCSGCIILIHYTRSYFWDSCFALLLVIWVLENWELVKLCSKSISIIIIIIVILAIVIIVIVIIILSLSSSSSYIMIPSLGTHWNLIGWVWLNHLKGTVCQIIIISRQRTLRHAARTSRVAPKDLEGRHRWWSTGVNMYFLELKNTASRSFGGF